MPSPEQHAAFFASITTRDEAFTVLKDGTEKLYAAIKAAAPETWGEIVPGPFGPWTHAAVGFAALHMMYHDGQLSSIHLLHGDTEMRWK